MKAMIGNDKAVVADTFKPPTKAPRYKLKILDPTKGIFQIVDGGNEFAPPEDRVCFQLHGVAHLGGKVVNNWAEFIVDALNAYCRTDVQQIWAKCKEWYKEGGYAYK